MTPKQIASSVTISVRANALQSVFDECDRYDHDETGGRLVGVAHQNRDGSLHIDVSGVIEPGPNARRSASSFFQDGDYQAEVFRRLETAHPEIEHLGNWHTHHVNGFPTLSGGDIATYQRIVNHEKHNLDFFYALLVVSRVSGQQGLKRYSARHYVLFRGDQTVYEVPPANISITEDPTIWPIERQENLSIEEPSHDVAVRARDKNLIEELFPDIRPYHSKRADTLYWKGPVSLIDGSTIQVTVPEITDAKSHNSLYYQAIVKKAPAVCANVVSQITERRYVSATSAIRDLEQQLNQTLYRALESEKS